MKKGIVILGAGRFAQMLAKYVQHDTTYKVLAFAVEERFVREASINGIGVVPLHLLPDTFAPADVRLLTGVGYFGMNELRMRLYRWGKDAGYEFVSYVCSDTRMVVKEDVYIGESCILLEGNTLQPGATLGAGVVVWSGSLVSHEVRIGDGSFIAAGVMIGGGAQIGKRCFVGMGAVIREDIQVADGTFVGAGVTILKGTQPGDVYIHRQEQPLRNVPAHVLNGFLLANKDGDHAL